MIHVMLTVACPFLLTPTRNFERFEFKEMELEPYQAKDVLRCLLHSILFNRALGSFQPKDAECVAVENVPYAKLDDPIMDDSLEGDIDRFMTSWTKSGSKKAKLSLSFYERVEKKSFAFFGGKDEKLHWERWVLPLVQHNEKDRPKTQADRDRVSAARHSRLLENLFYLVTMVNDRREHIPTGKLSKDHASSSSPSPLTFNWEINFAFGEKSEESWTINTLKRMLKQGPPMLLS